MKELKVTREYSEEVEKLQAAHVEEVEVKGDGGVVSDHSEMMREKEEDCHQGGSSEKRQRHFVGGGSLSKGDDGRYVGGGRGSLVETMINGGCVSPSEPMDLGRRVGRWHGGWVIIGRISIATSG